MIWAGAGNDTITTSAGVSHEALGSTICGEAGTDTITVAGYGHTCVDCGTGTDSMTYTQPLAACVGDVHDIATASGCETLAGDPPYADVVCACP